MRFFGPLPIVPAELGMVAVPLEGAWLGVAGSWWWWWWSVVVAGGAAGGMDGLAGSGGGVGGGGLAACASWLPIRTPRPKLRTSLLFDRPQLRAASRNRPLAFFLTSLPETAQVAGGVWDEDDDRNGLDWLEEFDRREADRSAGWAEAGLSAGEGWASGESKEWLGAAVPKRVLWEVEEECFLSESNVRRAGWGDEGS